MNPRRAPIPHARIARVRRRSGATRPEGPPSASAAPRPDGVLRDALADLRAAYHRQLPAPDLAARVGRAIREPALRPLPTRPRRRRVGLALVATVVTGLLCGYVGGYLGGDLGGRLAGPRDEGGAAPLRASCAAPALSTPAPREAAATRLASLLASAIALPRPDAATRRAWILATFDPDARVREAAALLLALAAPDARDRGP